MDDELSANARQLIDFAMDADVPPPVVVEGSWGMVVSRLTLETATERAPSTVAAVPTSRRRNVVMIATVLAFAAVAAVCLSRASGPTTGRTPAATPAAVPALPSSPAVEAHVATSTTTAPSPELLLDDADRALADEPLRALALVDRHAELAPLRDADRRMALRIAVLCALGRTADATAEATAFLGIPRTPASTARVRASCAVQ